MTSIEPRSVSGVPAARAVLVACSEDPDLERSMDELAELVRAAGAEVVGAVTQRARVPDPVLYVGSGKATELKDTVGMLRATLVVADDELSPIQRRNLERRVDVAVLDRTQVILDIFARRARSSEGKLQVELAQWTYLLPRLVGWGQTLSRLGGGIGTRGPGETKLEADRRRIKHRIAVLRRQIDEVASHRALQRRGRGHLGLPTVALVGYTNSGKSTLLNALAGSSVSTRNRPFETLDPTVRRVLLADGAQCLLSDTVGFVRKLPTQLVAAFRATLEEVVEADLLMHLVDASAPDVGQQMAAVEATLEEIGAASCHRVVVFNKIDRADPARLRELSSQFPGSVAISALYRTNLDALRSRLSQALARQEEEWEVAIPYGRAGVVAQLYRWGRVSQREYLPDAIQVRVALPVEHVGKLVAMGLVGEGSHRLAPASAGRHQDRTRAHAVEATGDGALLR